MHDGALPHYDRRVREFLNDVSETWIGRRPAPHIWPPRSPDLNPMDLFLWGAVKEIVYCSGQRFRKVPQLKNQIEKAFERLREIPNIDQKIGENMGVRMQESLNRNGDHVKTGQQAIENPAEWGINIVWVRRRNRQRN